MANTLRFKRGLASGIPTALAGEPLFTTDTFDLYIGNGTTNTRFQKYIASGATTQILRGDGSLYTFPLAISSPTTGQVLKYNGTSWVNDSDAGITGSLTTNYLPKATGATTLGNSLLQESTNAIGLSVTPSSWALYKAIQVQAASIANFNTVDNTIIGSNIYYGGSPTDFRYIADSTSTMYRLNGGAHYWFTATSGTANNVISFTQAMTLTALNNLLIGSTTDSGEKLQVTGTMKVTGASVFGSTVTSAGYRLSGDGTLLLNSIAAVQSQQIQYQNNGTNKWQLYLNTSNNNFSFFNSTNSADRLTLTESGNLGLGVTPSAWNGATGFQIANGGQIGSAGSVLTINTNAYYSAPNYIYITSAAAALYQQVNAEHRWSVAASGTAGNAITFTQAMTLDASGNLGVGVTSTTARLDIQNTAQYIANLSSSNASGGYISIGRNGALSNMGNYLSASGGGTAINADALFFRSPNGIGFGSAGPALSMWLTTSNNLVVGTSVDSGERLQVTGTAKITGLSSFGNTIQVAGGANIPASGAGLELAGGTSGTFLTSFNRTSGTYLTSGFNALSYSFLISGVEKFVITSSGWTGAGTNAPKTILDVYSNSDIWHFMAGGATSKLLVGGQGTGGVVLQGGAGSSVNNAAVSSPYNIILQRDGGNLLVGTTTDSGEKLQVNGTAKITGALSGSDANFSNVITAGGATNIDSSLAVQISSAGSGTQRWIGANKNGAYGLLIGYYENAAGLSGVGAYIRQVTTDPLYFVVNNGTTALTIASTGAATFSSSVTAGSFIPSLSTVPTNGMYLSAINTLGFATASTLNMTLDGSGYLFVGGLRIKGTDTNNTIYAGSSNIAITAESGYNISIGRASNTTSSININTTNGYLGIGMTPSYALDVTGSARVSDAIAIGTTPDTNNPFKILKNINATVGIKFENTNTSSLAFSAVQLGTDVSGGTKFTNLVYASSGVTASGVYNPDGTSLINNGNGGLNFLGNPIRMYTGGSNGVLRWDISNEGIIQYNATSPTTSATDAYKQYSADVTAGNAAPHFRTENGAVIKLYQETTAVGNAIISLGGGNAVLDDTTFDGYTLRQIVKALRNQGILA